MTLNIGVIGLGSMGALHLDVFEKIQNASVTAVCSRDPRKLAGDLRGLGGNLEREGRVHDFAQVHAYTDWRELIADPNVDAVDICLPSDAHAEVSIAAMAAGKHVLCEKPMALTSADCDRMLAAADQHGRVLMIAHTLRFWPDYNYLALFAREHSIVEAFFERKCGVPDWSAWLPDPSRSGGAIFDLMIHDIDQAISLFGVPDQVSAHSTGPVDTVRATLHYPHRKVHIEGGWLAPGTPFAMDFQVHAADQRLSYHGGVLQQCSAQERHTVDLSAQPQAYDAELRYFVECCVTNGAPVLCPPRESAQAVALAALLVRSRTRGGETLKVEATI